MNSTVKTRPKARNKPRQKKLYSYYNYATLFSYNAVFNFLVGGRGLGKSYGAKKKAIKDGITKGEQFMYVRRFYDSEMKPARATFLNDIREEFPDHDLRINGDFCQYAPVETRDEKKRQWHTIGYFVALSKAQGLKSTPYPDVTLIIFDEFIIEDTSPNTYLTNEADGFMNLFMTVDRYQDKTRVLFLANSVSIANPYFQKYGIKPDESGNQLYTLSNGFILCHFPDAKEFSREVKLSRLGKFIDGTDYAEYAIGNKFSDNHNSLVREKGSKSKYRYTLETLQGTFSVWYDVYSSEFDIQEKRPAGNEQMRTLIPGNVEPGKLLLQYSDKVMQIIRTAHRQGRVFFDAPQTRNAFLEVFNR